MLMKPLRGLYEWTLDKASHPHAVWWLAFFCFIESSFFPIPPHPLLGLMCLAEPKKAVKFATVATLASVAGALLGYAIGWGLYDTVGVWLISSLGLSEAFPVAACHLREYDFEAILIAGATPVPFKLLTITAGFVGMNLVTFVLSSLFARALIFMTVGFLFRVFGAPIKQVIDKYLGTVTTVFVVLVVGGILVLTQLGGSEDEAGGPCANVTAVNPAAE
ncbi:DedA family protein [Qipengyuania sp. 6B39]|uniref:YqaA family protein n=1 Tax=Qipengyuania proteolytica TaxID=2867239 RepID=UPI001C8A5A3A|nr:YqaA family protein [Qipengyuania proteolytica]MBX7494436.1 DedA family protein [Qipengyuania proteolytica]